MKKTIIFNIFAIILLTGSLQAMSPEEKEAAYQKIISPSTSATVKKTLINRFGGQAGVDAYVTSRGTPSEEARRRAEEETRKRAEEETRRKTTGGGAGPGPTVPVAELDAAAAALKKALEQAQSVGLLDPVKKKLGESFDLVR